MISVPIKYCHEHTTVCLISAIPSMTRVVDWHTKQNDPGSHTCVQPTPSDTPCKLGLHSKHSSDHRKLLLTSDQGFHVVLVRMVLTDPGIMCLLCLSQPCWPAEMNHRLSTSFSFLSHPKSSAQLCWVVPSSSQALHESWTPGHPVMRRCPYALSGVFGIHSAQLVPVHM